MLSCILLCCTFACQNSTRKEKDKGVVGKVMVKEQDDLGEILKNNKLTVLAENSATSYFIYRGQKMGLEYEILNQFAKEIGVKLEIKVVKRSEERRSTRLNSSHVRISYAVFCLKKKNK